MDFQKSGMERPTGVDEVDGRTRMLVGDEPGCDDLNVVDLALGDLGPEPVEHHLGDVDGDDPSADCGRDDRELARSCTDIDHRLGVIKPELDEVLEFLDSAGVFLEVVAAGMDRIEVLATSRDELVEHPPGSVLS